MKDNHTTAYWLAECLEARTNVVLYRELAERAIKMLTAPYGPNGSKASELMPNEILSLACNLELLRKDQA